MSDTGARTTMFCENTTSLEVSEPFKRDGVLDSIYQGTSPISSPPHPIGPYRTPIDALQWSWGGGGLLVSEMTLLEMLRSLGFERSPLKNCVVVPHPAGVPDS